MFERIISNERLKTIIFFVMCFALLFLYHRNPAFMDEADNLLGALNIANGSDIYKGYFSQHTPFVYYFMSIFTVLGIRDYETFRMCISFVILLTWIFMYSRYCKYFGKKVLLIFILLYVLTLNVTWGYMILSDVFQGYAVLILFFEGLIFQKKKTLTLESMIIISLCIFISTMSAFVSVYPIFIICLLFLYNILTLPSKEIFVRMKEYIKLITIIIIPFLMLIIWYLATGNLRNFYEQAYEMNRTYYSNYLGGFGSSVGGLFKSIPLNWTEHIKSYLLTLNKDSIFNSLLVVFNLLFVHIQFRKSRVSGVIIFFFIGFSGMRGYTDFHSLNYYIVSFFSVAYVVEYYFVRISGISEFKRVGIKVLTFLIFLISLNSYIPNAGLNIFKDKGLLAQNIYYDSYIQRLTTKNDNIWITSLTTQTYINNHRKPASRVTTLVPWFYDAYKIEMLNDLEKNKPKLIIFEKDNEVWGHVYADFAPAVLDFLIKYYEPLNEYDSIEKNIYVKKEEYKEISEELWPKADLLKEGMLVSNKSLIFIIENGLKRHIASPDVFDEKGYNWSSIIPIDDEIISRIKTGPEISGSSD